VFRIVWSATHLLLLGFPFGLGMPPCSSTSLLDRVLASARPSRPGKNGRRNDTQKIVRAIREKYPFLPDTAMYQHLVDGKSLFAYVEIEFLKMRGLNKNVSPGFWEDVEQKYNIKSYTLVLSPSEAGKNLPINVHLLEALNVARSRNVSKRSTKPLSQLFGNLASVNEREYVGLCNFFLAYKSVSTPAACTLCLQFMRIIVRLNLDAQFPSLTQQLRHLFDEALCSSFASINADGLTLRGWWQIYANIAKMVVNEHDVYRILACESTWLSVSDPLVNVVNGSTLGTKMFSFALQHLTEEKVEATIADSLANLVAKAHISRSDVLAYHAAITGELAQIPDGLTMRLQRPLPLKYRLKVDIVCPCNTPLELASVKLGHKLREMYVGRQGGIDELCFEKGSFDTPLGDVPTIDDDVLAPYRHARQACAAALVHADNGEVVDAVFAQRSQVWKRIDDSFDIECLVQRALRGAEGEKLIQELTLSTLPTDNNLCEMSHAINQLEGVRKSAVYEFAAHQARSPCVAVLDCLKKMQSGIAPSEQHMKSTEFMRKVLEALARFATFIEQGEGGPTTLIGAAAMRLHFRELIKKHAREKLTLEDIQIFHVFRWLVEENHMKKVEQFTAELLQGVTTTSKKSKAPKEDTKAAKKQKTEADEIMALFG